MPCKRLLIGIELLQWQWQARKVASSFGDFWATSDSGGFYSCHRRKSWTKMQWWLGRSRTVPRKSPWSPLYSRLVHPLYECGAIRQWRHLCQCDGYHHGKDFLIHRSNDCGIYLCVRTQFIRRYYRNNCAISRLSRRCDCFCCWGSIRIRSPRHISFYSLPSL